MLFYIGYEILLGYEIEQDKGRVAMGSQGNDLGHHLAGGCKHIAL
jgi:hypothetical protein